jgi:hypothetical protein
MPVGALLLLLLMLLLLLLLCCCCCRCLFKGTLMDNIALRRRGITHDDVLQVARRVHLHAAVQVRQWAVRGGHPSWQNLLL